MAPEVYEGCPITESAARGECCPPTQSNKLGELHPPLLSSQKCLHIISAHISVMLPCTLPCMYIPLITANVLCMYIGTPNFFC